MAAVKPIKAAELLKEIQKCMEQKDYRANGLLLDLVVLPLPSRVGDLRKERGELEEFRRKAGRFHNAWDYCEDRIKLIDSELGRRHSHWSTAREWVILAVAVAALVTAFLFGYKILPPKSVTPTSVEGQQ